MNNGSMSSPLERVIGRHRLAAKTVSVTSPHAAQSTVKSHRCGLPVLTRKPGYGAALHKRRRRHNPIQAVSSPYRDAIQTHEGQQKLQESAIHGVEKLPFGTIPEMWKVLAERHKGLTAVFDPHNTPVTELTYEQLHSTMQTFAAGLHELGLRKGDRVSLFSENSARWIIADQAVMLNGAVDAVRGATTPLDELAYILLHSESSAMVVQDVKTLERVLPIFAAPSSGAGNGQEPHDISSCYPQIREAIRFIIVLWGEPTEACRAALPCPALSFNDILQAGHTAASSGRSFQPAAIGPGDLATLVYTSGTTGPGVPDSGTEAGSKARLPLTGVGKAAALTHGNLLSQTANFDFYMDVQPGDVLLSLLPPWHIYERSTAYHTFFRGCKMVYTNIRQFRTDLRRYPPDILVCVPLVLDTLYTQVMKTISQGSAFKRALARGLLAASTALVQARRIAQGVALQYAREPAPPLRYFWAAATAALLLPLHRLAQKLVYSKIREAVGVRKAVVSGGGSLAAHLDNFFEAVGLPVLNGWGLTETSPVLACRRMSPPLQNVRGSVGLPIPGTQLRVVDPDTLQDVPDGQQGLVLAKGPGVMQGYYNDESGTVRAFRAGNGWFDTGDLGWRAPEGVPGSTMAGTIVLTGRAKDTIVLSSGENVEPQPLEDALCASPAIKQAIIIGQDHRGLGALVVPDMERLEELLGGGEDGPDPRSVEQYVRAEISKVQSGWPRSRHVVDAELLPAPFSFEDGTLTRTMKPRRPIILAKYADHVQRLLSRLR